MAHKSGTERAHERAPTFFDIALGPAEAESRRPASISRRGYRCHIRGLLNFSTLNLVLSRSTRYFYNHG